MEKQKQRNDFVLSVAGPNIDLTIINIEEMALYCKNRNRLANVVTQKKTYNELDKLNYSLIMNYTKPRPRVVNTKDKQFHDVYRILSEKYRGGLLIAENDTLSEPVSDIICNKLSWQDNDVDLMICRDSFSMVMEDELQKASYLRISADPGINPNIFAKFENILKERTIGIMISQFFVNENYENVNKYMDIVNTKYQKEGMTDYVDYYELNKQLAFFVYFDMGTGKILNLGRETVKGFIEKMAKNGIPVIPADKVDAYVDMITV